MSNPTAEQPLMSDGTPWNPGLGPRPLPTFHGKGCICHMYAKADCPAAQTEEGKRRDAYRKLNGARLRVRRAHKGVVDAAEELTLAQAELDKLETGP